MNPSKQCSANSACHLWEVRAAFKWTNAHARVRECVEGFSLWMSVAAKMFLSARTNTGLLNAITMHMQIFLGSVLHSIKSILSLVWHKLLEPQLQNPCCSSTLVSPVFFSFFFCARREISQCICEPPCVYFIYSKTILTLSQIGDRFAFSQSVPRFILQVGLSISILYQPQGWGRDSLIANEICIGMQQGTIHVYLTSLHVVQLLHGQDCHTGPLNRSQAHGGHEIFRPSFHSNFFLYSCIWTDSEINLSATPSWQLLLRRAVYLCNRKGRTPLLDKCPMNQLGGKQIPSLKEAYYLVQLKIY